MGAPGPSSHFVQVFFLIDDDFLRGAISGSFAKKTGQRWVFLGLEFGGVPDVTGLRLMECWNLEPWLENKGLGDANQVLAYFAVSKLGEPPVDGIINTNPEGRTASYGKWASAVADRLHAGGLTCKVLGKEAFQKQMLEKLIWISAFMLVGARHPGATVGGVEKDTALRFPASLQSLPLQQLLRSDWYLKEPWRIDYVRTHELLPTFLLQSKSLNREMVGSIPSLKGQLQKESLIPAPYIRHGSKN
ncbi:uncharacterized protein LOC112184431 [Rosa chinensis]|uniref:uncharacterized protein LOC112184431 n=1 Tax=Rosa chinensis TaxID=74649 RepID=UPI000D08EA2A|nr:uncharacterized protein LOC112184431 [Rosa chinensis]